MAKAGTQQRNPQPLALYIALMGAVTTLIGAYDRFGLSGGFVLVAILFVSVGFLLLLEQTRSGRVQKAWEYAKRLGRRPRDFFYSALVALVLAVGLYVTGYASLRVRRSHLPLVVPNLRIADVQFLHQRFPRSRPGIRERGENLLYREHASTALLRWAGDFSRTKKGRQLYYLQSEAIPKDCDDVIVSCVAAEPMIVMEAAAFLVSSQVGDVLWKRPIMRKQNTIINDNGTRLTINLAKPDKNERLVIVLLGSSYTSQASPDEIKEAAEPDHLLRHHFFEFE